MSVPSQRWLLRRPSPTAEARMFCLPYAGGGASVYRGWPRRVGPLETCSVQLPGRENRLREAAFGDFADYARAAATALQPYLDRPFMIFGHCMGALLAHALVVELAKRPGPDPALLAVSSSRVPHWPPPRRYKLPSPGSTGVYHASMADDELGAEIQKVAGRQGGTVGDELLPIAVKVLRGDLDMCFGYAPTRAVPVPCPISLMTWDADADVAVDEMRAWSACGPTTLHQLKGDKMTFFDAPSALLEAITDDWAARAEIPVVAS